MKNELRRHLQMQQGQRLELCLEEETDLQVGRKRRSRELQQHFGFGSLMGFRRENTARMDVGWRWV